jgi:hypothetical protein
MQSPGEIFIARRAARGSAASSAGVILREENVVTEGVYAGALDLAAAPVDDNRLEIAGRHGVTLPPGAC